jgi:DNA segregation ATPase FtsK/SpoIIIE-like protein
LKEKQQSSLEINCPVTYLTSVDALKKKNQQQAAFLNMQNASQIAPAPAPAGPKPFPLPSLPVLNDSFLNAPFNINISTIQGENAEAVDEPVAPSEKSKKASKKSSEI